MTKSKRLSIAVFALVALAGISTVTFSLQAAAKPAQNLSGEILFVSWPPNKKSNIYAVRGDGSGLRKISRQPISCIGTSWSPDKKSIVTPIATKVGVVQKRNVWRYNLAIINVRTGAVRNIRITGHSSLKTFAPAFAPSGREILFTGSVRQNYLDLYTVKLDGSDLKQLTKNGNASQGRFDPSGNKIVFCAFRDGRDNISTMNSNGGNISQLTNNGIKNQTPVWSPNGKKIAFASNRSGTFQIYAMNADGSAQRQLTRGKESHLSPTFSPDGRQIAFTQRIKNLQQIYLMNADGTSQTRLISRKDGSRYLDWR